MDWLGYSIAIFKAHKDNDIYQYIYW